MTPYTTSPSLAREKIMKKALFAIYSLIPIFMSALEIDIIANFDIEHLPARLLPVKESFDVKIVSLSDYFQNKSSEDPNLSKIVVFNPYFDRDLIRKLPKEKLILFVWEPETSLPSSLYDNYSKVYTWDDTLIDNQKFFRFNYPYLMAMQENNIPFEEKKLCVMVTGHWTTERLTLLKFFEWNHPNDLDCYGWNKPGETPLWKGCIPGLHSGPEKISILQKYRFCICFENITGIIKGYITEKIFGCFAAGCIPVYWGAENIEDYIPKSCFIDYRDFESDEKLYRFLVNMSSEQHQNYIRAIQDYLHSEQAEIFSPAFFDNLVYEAITK